MNAHGRVCCLDASTGKEIWALEMFEHFGGKTPTWATSENLLVDGPRVIVTPGGSRALMASSGALDNCGYASPILIQSCQRRMILNCSVRHAFGVDADTGQLLWTRPLPTRYSVIAATPVLVEDAVFVTAPDTNDGGKLFRIRASDIQAHVLMLHGTKDRLVPPANVEFLERELQKVSKKHLFAKVIVPGGNHFLPWEHPEIVRDAVNELLSACAIGYPDVPKTVLRSM
jgi:pimeloyl-ACP methyl ester carboxylesterase